MSRFRVGDVCEILHGECAPTGRNPIGMECTVIEGFMPSRLQGNYECKNCYVVKAADSRNYVVAESRLRLKRPPSWDTWLYDTKDVERENSNQALASCTDALASPVAGGQAEYPAAFTGGAPCR